MTDAVLIALIAFPAQMVLAAGTLVVALKSKAQGKETDDKVEEVKHSMNSILDKRVKTEGQKKRAQGKAEGVAQERRRKPKG